MTTDDFLRQRIIPLAYRQLSAGELMSRAAAGDAEAFVALVCLKFSMIEGVCRQSLGSRQPAEDIALEAFVELWRQRRKIRDPDAVDGWLAQTARNLANKHAAAQARGRVAGLGWFHRQRATEPLAVKPPDRAAIQEEIVRRVRLALAEQSDADQRLLWTAENSGGDAHAAEALNLPLSTYRVRLHRARQRLRALLRKYGVAPVVGAVAFVGSAKNRAAAVVAQWWATTAGKALLIGLTLCGLAAVVGWALMGESNPSIVEVAHMKHTAAPANTVPVESLQVRNERFVRNEIVDQLRDITQRFYPPDNPLRLVDVRAFGSEVEVEFQATRPPPQNDQANRMRGRYCTWRRRLVVHGQPAGMDRWYRMNIAKPVVFNVPLPPIGATIEIVLGREAYVAVERLFDQLPRDPQAESEHLRFLFGEPGGELRLPAGANGFAVDSGRMWLVDGDMEMYARDSAGRWRYEGICPGWWLIAHDGQFYCTAGDEILTRPIDAPGKPWILWKKIPEMKPGERGGFLAISGDRFYFAVHPGVLCHCPLADPKASWVRNENTPIWPDGIAATTDRLFAHDANHILSRPAQDASAAWTRVAPIPDGKTWLVVDGERLLAYGAPGSIYARPLTAGPEVDWEIVGKAHEPLRR